jgi:uncharacterized protein YjbJ (UPF0337 family)
LSCLDRWLRQGKKGAAFAAIYFSWIKEFQMKWQQIENDWRGFKPQVLAKWSKLTDEQLNAIAGKRDKLAAKVCEVYALNKDETEKQIKSFEDLAKQPEGVKETMR